MTEQYGAVVEAILFASADPVDMERICEVTQLDKLLLSGILNQLMEKYADDAFGIEIVRLDDSYQMVTKQKYADAVRQALTIKKNTPLSSAAYEVLAIIAYNQPVTKSFIEQIRGVDSSSIVNTLVSRGLVEEDGRLNLPGRPIAYRTTQSFLRSFSMQSLSDLPKIEKKESSSGSEISSEDLSVRSDA